MSIGSIRLAELTADHLDAVAAIESVSSDLPWSRSLFAGELVMPVSERHWLVALAGADVVGFGGMMLVGEDAHLMNIAVEPSLRRRGLAQRLLAQLIVDVVEMGARHLTLEVRTDNIGALRLYERFGFAQAGVRPNYYAKGIDAAILWRHDIDAPDHLAGLHRDFGATP